VPYSAGGRLRIVASSDLGALGAKNGAPVEYDWVLPSVAPLLLPWLAILGLLALKPNRRAAAWLIWLPLGCVMGLAAVPQIFPAGAGDTFADIVTGLAFGLAAVWLLSPYLRRTGRWLTLLCVLPALGGSSLLALMARQGWDLLDTRVLPTGIVLVVAVLATAVALTLDGWICRRRYRPVGIYLWLCALLACVWVALAIPVFVVVGIASGGPMPSWSEFLIPVLCVAIGNFALLLPFLILSSATGFFRERVTALLHVRAEAPPLPVPAPETIVKS